MMRHFNKCIIYIRICNRIQGLAQLPQLIWCQVLLRADGMVGPRLTEDIQTGLDAWQENVVAIEYVQDVADVKQVLVLKRVQGVVIHKFLRNFSFSSL